MAEHILCVSHSLTLRGQGQCPQPAFRVANTRMPTGRGYPILSPAGAIERDRAMAVFHLK